MYKIFNTQFEIAMRLLILLDIYKIGIDSEKIIYLDFFTIYAKDYGFENYNINGFHYLSLNSFTTRRRLINDSLKELILMEVINVKASPNGFLYLINEKGISLCANMTSTYAKNYRKSATIIKSQVNDMTIDEIKEIANIKGEKRKNVIDKT